MKEFKHLGVYGLLIQNEKVLLIKKNGGPYDGMLDLPGGTIEFCERPQETLIREMKEEVGIEVKSYELLDADSVSFDWKFRGEVIRVHHIAIFYKVTEYTENVVLNIEINDKNDDSLGADFYEIAKLQTKDLSKIALLLLDKLGYNIN